MSVTPPNPVAGGSGLNQQNICQNQPIVPGNDAAAQLARQIQTNTNVTMKTEVVKLPDFYGDPAKGTITALKFMARIDDCQVTNEWSNITTFSYFRLALRGQADKWLSSVVQHLQLTPAQKTWTRIRPSFKTEFVAFLDDKLIIDGLAKLSHRPNANPRIFFSRLEKLIFILKENYASYCVNPDRPAQEAGGGYSEDALTKAIKDNMDNFANFMFTQMFKAGAPENVRHLLSHKDQTRLIVVEAYKIYFTDHRLDMDMRPVQVHTIAGDPEAAPLDHQNVAAFRPQQRQQNRGPQQNFNNRGNNCSSGQGYRSNYNNGNHQNSNQPKSNASRNSKFCVYCKIMNHTLEECRRRINNNKPCVTSKGQLYWPKVNSTNDNPNTVQQNSNPNAIDSVFH
jgi:hypothetical protein